MKKLFCLILIVATVFTLCACSSNGYKLTVEDPEELIIEPLEKRYEAGETVIIKTAIVTDVSVEAFVNGESIGTQTAVKTGDEYTHWEFTFVMPECDVTLTFVISDGFDVLP